MRFRPSDTQMIWDWSVEYFATSPSRCSIPGIGCRYLRQDGHRCVIGSMFQEENRNDQTLLLNYFGPIRELVPMLRPYMPSLEWVTQAEIRLLTDIQVIHDSSDTWDSFGVRDLVRTMTGLAQAHNLRTDYIDTRGYQ